MTLSIRKILLPVTLEDDSRAVLLQAAWLARHFGAELLLLHVAPPKADFHDEAWDRLDHGLFAGIAVTRLVRHGHPAPRIVAAARAEKADLIVMATHPRWRSGVAAEDIAGSDRLFQRFVIHAVAARVIDDAPCAVWACPAELQAQPGVRHVLCHVDLKSHSRTALDKASAFAAATGARLSLAHATASTDIHAERHAAPHVKAWAEAFAQSAAGRIAALQAQAGTTAETIIENGEAPPALAAVAARTGADLVTALHWQAPNYWEESSGVFDILRHAHTPVLVFGPRRSAALQAVARPALSPAVRAWLVLAAAGLAAIFLWVAYNFSVEAVCANQPGHPVCLAMWFHAPPLPEKLPPRPIYKPDPGLGMHLDRDGRPLPEAPKPPPASAPLVNPAPSTGE